MSTNQRKERPDPSKNDELIDIELHKEEWREGLPKPQPDREGRLDLLETPRNDEATYLDKIGFPGRLPFTRGVYESMYSGQLWTMRQYAGYATPSETNRRYHKLLETGQTGLSVAFDLPTQMGYDSDQPEAEGEVGRVGVSIDGLWDMDELMANIDLTKVSTSMTINATAAILLGMYAGIASLRNQSAADLSGTVQNDILKEYVSRGTFIFPPKHSLRLTVDLMEYCLDTLPKWNPISVSGYHMREAGATAAQELGFTFGHAMAYADAAAKGGLDLRRLIPRFSFFFGVHNNFLEEVSKFRAGRRLWARLVKDRLGIDDASSRRMRFHAQTCGSTLTAQQPLNNCSRTTLQGLAAVLGGTQSLHVNAHDEALGLPSEAGVEFALRAQQIIAYESGVCATIDPLAGSYAVEKLTDRIEEEALEAMDLVDSNGGPVEAASSGFTASRIADSAYETQRSIERSEQVVVGVNRFVTDSEPHFPPFSPPGDTEFHQKGKLDIKKRERDTEKVRDKLSLLEDTASGTGNICEAIASCCLDGATVGEISDKLRKVFGRHNTTRGIT
ncbi:MAG TPA: methylmalonyl-CoA mutase [Candidatus Latescibacteria bacterium]|nr:methylmalonyl-CoA mutase [Gemmatimonadota bacterium]HCR16686.1 methylmalonyl-CoA mutase [Candidatus Latescibacterota bacterium]